MSLTIAILDPLPAERLERMQTLLPAGFRLINAESRSLADQRAALALADFAISGDMPITDDLLAAAPALRAVHKWGVGIDNFDLAAAKARGVRIFRTTGSNARPVAETAVGLMLMLQRSLHGGDRGLRDGRWLKPELGPRTFMLSGKTVGLVGLGAIGKNVARLLRGFDCTLLYAKPDPLPPEEAAALAVQHVPLDRLLATSDIVSLHCPLTVATRGLIGAAELARMKPTALLINTARGGIVDEQALANALRDGVIRGAALDVFAEEPMTPDHPLLAEANAIVTPHIAAQAADNLEATLTRMFRNLADCASGRPVAPLDVVV